MEILDSILGKIRVRIVSGNKSSPITKKWLEMNGSVARTGRQSQSQELNVNGSRGSKF